MGRDSLQARIKSRQANFKRGINKEKSTNKRYNNLLSICKINREVKITKRCRRVDKETQSSQSIDQTNSSLQLWINRLAGNTYDEVFPAMVYFRKMLSLKNNPPIQNVIDAGIVPKIVQLCTSNNYPELQYEAVWVITNIASGSDEQTRCVIDSNAIPVLIQLLQSSNHQIREQCIWAIGNIVGNGPEDRDLVLNFGVLQPLLETMFHAPNLTTLSNGAWVLNNLTRGKPYPPFEIVSSMFPCLAKLITLDDEDIIIDTCKAMSNLSNSSNNGVEAIIQLGVVPRLINLLSSENFSIQFHALHAIGNITTGTNIQTDMIISEGVIPIFCMLMKSKHRNIRKNAVWAISNITAGTTF